MKKWGDLFIWASFIAVTVPEGSILAQQGKERVVVFGTLLDPAGQIAESRQLAQSLANPDSPQWRTKGDRRRIYRFPDANADIPCRDGL